MIAAHRSASFTALGTTALVAVDEPGALGEAEAVLRGELDRIDRACSRFREDSELSGVNRAMGEEVEVSALLIEALEVALRAAAITDGDVDPTVGRAMGELGYDRDFSLVPGARPGVRVRLAPVPGWRTVQVDARTARSPSPGAFGSTSAPRPRPSPRTGPRAPSTTRRARAPL